MRWAHKKTPEKVEQAREMFAAGMCYEHIARAMNIGSGGTIRRWLDPNYAEIRRQEVRDRRFAYPPDLFKYEAKPSAADLKARWSEIPPDTRDMTGTLCGDPLPGRSALDKQRTQIIVSSAHPATRLASWAQRRH